MNDHPVPGPSERAYWLDQPDNIRLLVRILIAVCGLLLVIEPFVDRHPHFAFEEWFGFYAWYGFLGCCFIVLSAMVLRRVVARPEDYYDR